MFNESIFVLGKVKYGKRALVQQGTTVLGVEARVYSKISQLVSLQIILEMLDI